VMSSGRVHGGMSRVPGLVNRLEVGSEGIVIVECLGRSTGVRSIFYAMAHPLPSEPIRKTPEQSSRAHLGR